MKKLFLFFAVFLCSAFLFAETGDVQDLNACEYARKARKVSVWKEYLKSYPEGACKFEAKNEIKRLKKINSEQKGEEDDAAGINKKPVKYYRPYKKLGIPLLIIGLLADISGVGACVGGAVAGNSSAEIGGFVATGIGLPMWVLGAALITKKKPVPNQNVEISNLSVAPTKGGAYASLGLKF